MTQLKVAWRKSLCRIGFHKRLLMADWVTGKVTGWGCFYCARSKETK